MVMKQLSLCREKKDRCYNLYKNGFKMDHGLKSEAIRLIGETFGI